MIDKLLQGGAEDQIAELQRIVAADRRFSTANRLGSYGAGLNDGRGLVVHSRGGERVGLRFPNGESLLSGREDIVQIFDRQGIATARFTMSEPPEGIALMTQAEMQQVSFEQAGTSLYTEKAEMSFT